MASHFTDRSQEVLAALKSQLQVGLNAAGEEAVSNAKDIVHVRTGALRDSIEHQVNENEVVIGSSLDYALEEEMRGGNHTFIKPAVADHQNELIEIIKTALQS